MLCPGHLKQNRQLTHRTVRTQGFPDVWVEDEVGSLHDLLFARSLGHRFGAGAAPIGSALRTRVPRPSGVGLLYL